VLSVAQKFVFIRGFSFLVAAKGCAMLTSVISERPASGSFFRQSPVKKPDPVNLFLSWPAYPSISVIFSKILPEPISPNKHEIVV